MNSTVPTVTLAKNGGYTYLSSSSLRLPELRIFRLSVTEFVFAHRHRKWTHP